MIGDRRIVFAQPLQRSNLCASHRLRRWLTYLSYPVGQEDYPVGGVSWYEAAAYVEYVGKSLPSVDHWLGGAQTLRAAEVTPLANFEGDGPVPVGSREAMSPRGPYDMAGNVKEWCSNSAGDLRYILGGGWTDAPYFFHYPVVRPPFDRSPSNGFRGVQYLNEALSPEVFDPIGLPARGDQREPPVTDDVFEIYAAQYDYDASPLDAVAEAIDQEVQAWRRERVRFNAAYGDECVIADIFLPANVDPPYQTVVFFPGSTTIFLPSIENQVPLEFIIQNGRAVVYPVYKSTFERRDGLASTWPDATRSFTEHVIYWVNDARRTVDYLETRPDIDTDKLAFVGLSWGGRMGAIVPALEQRFRAVVLYSGALSLREARPEANQVNFAPRVTAPVLMLNGRHDFLEPVDTAQIPLFELFGAPEENKRHVIFEEAGHWPLPKNALIRETLDWLDKYLGLVS